MNVYKTEVDISDEPFRELYVIDITFENSILLGKLKEKSKAMCLLKQLM